MAKLVDKNLPNQNPVDKSLLLKAYLIQYKDIAMKMEIVEIKLKKSDDDYKSWGELAEKKISLERERKELAFKIANLMGGDWQWKKDCKNCMETGIAELTDRVVKLEKDNKQSEKNKQDAWNKTMMKIVFYGAVAQGIAALFYLAGMIINFFNKGK